MTLKGGRQEAWDLAKPLGGSEELGAGRETPELAMLMKMNVILSQQEANKHINGENRLCKGLFCGGNTGFLLSSSRDYRVYTCLLEAC